MLLFATQKKLRYPTVLFYANRYLEDAAFIDELWKWSVQIRGSACSYPHDHG
jgi:hypothetical protein